MDLKGGSNDVQKNPNFSISPTEPKPKPAHYNHGFSALQAFGIIFLTFNSYTAIQRSKNDPWNIAFIVFSYVNLILLFVCLHLFERTPEENSSRRGQIKAALWLLSSSLTAIFSYKVAGIMPLVMKVVIWLMAGSSIGGGFYALFIYRDSKEEYTAIPVNHV